MYHPTFLSLMGQNYFHPMHLMCWALRGLAAAVVLTRYNSSLLVLVAYKKYNSPTGCEPVIDSTSHQCQISSVVCQLCPPQPPGVTISQAVPTFDHSFSRDTASCSSHLK